MILVISETTEETMLDTSLPTDETIEPTALVGNRVLVRVPISLVASDRTEDTILESCDSIDETIPVAEVTSEGNETDGVVEATPEMILLGVELGSNSEVTPDITEEIILETSDTIDEIRPVAEDTSEGIETDGVVKVTPETIKLGVELGNSSEVTLDTTDDAILVT